jgi:hypothetical protein
MGPETDPVTEKFNALLKWMVTVSGTAPDERSIAEMDDPEGFVLALAERAEVPRFPLTLPVTPKAVGEVNSTVRISDTGVPVNRIRLIVPLFEVLPAANLPAKS